MEIQRLRFGAALDQVFIAPAGALLHQFHLLHAAVDLVGGGINEDRIPIRKPRRFERVKRSERVGLEIVARIGDRGGDGHLSCQMYDHICILCSLPDRRRVANIADDDVEGALSKTLLQPFQVSPRAAAGEIIVYGDFFAAL